MLSRLDGAWAFPLAAVALWESPALAQTPPPSGSASAEAAPAPPASSAPPAPLRTESAPTAPSPRPVTPFAPTLGLTPPPAPGDDSAPVPFGFADFTWLNGANRQREAILDSPLFTGTAILDANYVYDFNQPVDHTISGSTVTVRSNELQILVASVGGDFHYQNVHATLTTQLGLYTTIITRNDPSTGRGQFDLGTAMRYIREANAGYHWDVWSGINLDVGIFMSYIGLFSYLNFENWAYQPSYVSDNTPFFFDGLRLQAYTSDKAKAELWLINGWQSYGMFNETPGLGFQLQWRPNGAVSAVSNGYAGFETQDNPGRLRVHSDSSFLLKYYDDPGSIFDKGAFSVTLDAGCEQNGGVTCVGGTAAAPNQSFLGFMFYNRFWFMNDIFGLTIGGGAITNPGRYLVLLPPIQGATAITGTPYFPETPGTEYKAWDGTVTFDYMPNQFWTYRLEYNHRAADVPYFSGHGGVTSPDGWSNAPVPPGWRPDLVKSEDRINAAFLFRL
jgi:hypothetical protein